MSRPLCSHSLIVALAVLVGAAAPAAAAQQWRSSYFSAPNGGLLVFTITPKGNPACASYNGRDCLWGVKYNQIDFNRVQPLICGADHRAKSGE